MVRCKMKLNSITRSMSNKSHKNEAGVWVHEPVEMQTLNFSPVYSDDPKSENRKFWDASPGGKLELNCVNKAAVEGLKLDGEYYIDISEAVQA